MEDKILGRLDQMIMQHELLLAKAGGACGSNSNELRTEIRRLEAGLYGLREGVHGFMKARECGLPLENLTGYLGSLEVVANKAEKSLLDAIKQLEIKNGNSESA